MTITDTTEVRRWLGPGPADELVEQAWKAADQYVADRTEWEGRDADPPVPAPDDLVLAVKLLTNRYLARRNSPDGMVGVSDLGPAAVPTRDRDIERLLDPWRFWPVA